MNTTPSATPERTETPEAPALASAAPATTRSASRLTSPARAGREAGSTLAEENRLMQAALSAARNGQNGQAVRLLTELLARYPRSLLAQNAQVERFRALKRSGDENGAARLALYYLNQYPNGMAADEARKLAAAAGSFRDEHAL